MREIDTWKLKQLLLPVLITIAFVVFLMKLLLPKVAEGRNGLRKIEEIKDKTRLVTERVSYLRSVDQDWLANQERWVRSSLMEGNNPYGLVFVVAEVAKGQGYSLESFSVSPGVVGEEKQGSKTEEVSVSLSMIGPRAAYVDLLSALESSLPVMTIKNFKMKGGDKELAELELSLASYYLTKRLPIDLAKLSLKDLVLEEKELALLERLSSLKLVEGWKGAGASGEMVQYERADPFNF